MDDLNRDREKDILLDYLNRMRSSVDAHEIDAIFCLAVNRLSLIREENICRVEGGNDYECFGQTFSP